MSRQFGTRIPDTDAARKKARIGGGIIAVAIAIELLACILGPQGASRGLITGLLYFGGGLVLVGVVYMFVNRRAS